MIRTGNRDDIKAVLRLGCLQDGLVPLLLCDKTGSLGSLFYFKIAVSQDLFQKPKLHQCHI
jgi:hypothetical protein